MGVTLRGTVESLWRYPVKSMRGEELDEAFLGFAGVYGDRLYAFTSTAKSAGFPFLTARDRKEMLRCRPRFRTPEHARQPPNLAEAQNLGPGITPLYPNMADLIVDVEMPSGAVIPIDDPALIEALFEGLGSEGEVKLVRSERSLTDCRPVSVFSLQTARAIGEQQNTAIDTRRFRANILADFPGAVGFPEDELVGRNVRIGSRAVVAILERDPRCKMITLDPETGESDPTILRAVAQNHESKAGVYGAVLVEEVVRRGDAIEVLT